MDLKDNLIFFESRDSGENAAESAKKLGNTGGELGSVRCPICGFNNLDEAEVCAKCGQRLKPVRAMPSGAQVSAETDDELGFEGLPRGEETLAQESGLSTGESQRHSVAFPKEPSGIGGADAGDGVEPSTPFPLGLGDFPSSAQPTEIRYYFGSEVQPQRILIPSGVFARASAFLIDLVILFLLGSILASLLGVQSALTEYEQRVMEVGILNASALQEKYPELASVVFRFFSFFIALIVGYFGIFSAVGGQTVGKAIVGIRLVKVDGGNVGFFASFARAFVIWFLIHFTAGIYVVLSAFLISVDARGRAPHDHLFGTTVTRVR